jgi:hypothetical protein
VTSWRYTQLETSSVGRSITRCGALARTSTAQCRNPHRMPTDQMIAPRHEHRQFSF